MANIEVLARSIPDTAHAIGIGRTMLCEMIKEGRGPRVTKIGRRSLILVEDCATWLRGLAQGDQVAA